MEKRDWKKIVADSDKASVFLPEKFQAAVKEYQAKRLAFNKSLDAVAKQEIEMNLDYNKLMFEIREHLDSAGVENWQKDIGLNIPALQDGEFIINITDQKRGE